MAQKVVRSVCVFTKQVDFINNKDGHFLYIAAILPAAANSIPLLWSGDNQISLSYGPHVRSHIACQLYHPRERQRETRKKKPKQTDTEEMN